MCGNSRDLCESTDRITRRMIEQMTREDALKALQNLIEMDKDLHMQMNIIREKLWPGSVMG